MVERGEAMKYLPFILLACLAGCMTAKVSGTGVNVQDQAHFVDVQANSFNAEVNTNVP